MKQSDVVARSRNAITGLKDCNSLFFELHENWNKKSWKCSYYQNLIYAGTIIERNSTGVYLVAGPLSSGIPTSGLNSANQRCVRCKFANMNMWPAEVRTVDMINMMTTKEFKKLEHLFYYSWLYSIFPSFRTQHTINTYEPTRYTRRCFSTLTTSITSRGRRITSICQENITGQ